MPQGGEIAFQIDRLLKMVSVTTLFLITADSVCVTRWPPDSVKEL